MKIKGTLPPYTTEKIVVKFDDAIEDLEIEGPHQDLSSTEMELYILRCIHKGFFEGGHSHMTHDDYFREILDGNAWFVSKPSEKNPDILEILDAIGDGRKINAIKIVRYLTGCGLKEAKDYVEEYWESKKPSVTYKEASFADIVQEDL